MNAPIKAAIVIDHWELIRRGVETVLSDRNFLVAGSTSRSSEGLALARSSAAELVIVGKSLDLKPLNALTVAKKEDKPPKVMLMVDRADGKDVARLISAGVDALLLRSSSVAEIASAIEKVEAGERVVAPALAADTIGRVGPLIGADADLAAKSPLSPKELEVLTELASGATYDEIAASLVVGKATVKTHLVHAYGKLGVKNRQEAVTRALALGLLG